MISRTDQKPYMNVVFGNFYSPAYDDEAFIDETMSQIKELGFNSVMFDTKAWEDFKERCESGVFSQYVKMQEYMGLSAHEHGLSYNFLLLYLNGDNLYPHIRFSPPIYGEETVRLDGTPGRWYKYWSKKAMLSMTEHVGRIMNQYGSGCEKCVITKNGVESEVVPVCSMWDPVVAASFDAEGKERYVSFLKDLYKGNVDQLNQAYGTKADCFFDLCPQDYWYQVRYGEEAFTEEDVKLCTPRFCVWRDQALWKMHELMLYFKEMRDLLKDDFKNNYKILNDNYRNDCSLNKDDIDKKINANITKYYVEKIQNISETENDKKSKDNLKIQSKVYSDKNSAEKQPDLFLCPNMSQWGYFLNIYGRQQADLDNEFSDLWDTAVRGIDMYALAPFVDCCHFMTVPTTPDGYPDAYVVSCQHSMMRVMNEGRTMIGGIYWGRYIYNDLYAFLTPAEIIGTMTACGIDGYTCYGMNGLDDGGVLNRMETSFLDSLKIGNHWCAKVIPERIGHRKKEIALLFPSEMAHLEPFEVGNNKIRRLDLLGWYKICCDLGYQTDVISTHQIEKGALNDYAILIVPANDCYFAVEHEALEAAVKDWVKKGGVLVHGPNDGLAQSCFGIRGETCGKMPYVYDSTIISQGEAFCRYFGGTSIADYVDGGGCCVAEYKNEALMQLAGRVNHDEALLNPKEGTRQSLRDEAFKSRQSLRDEAFKSRQSEVLKDLPHDLFLGAVYSFGVQIGASYASKNIPHVPYGQGNREMYPITLSKTTLVQDIFMRYIRPAGGICERGIETGVFENGMVIVNHRSASYELPRKYAAEYFQYPAVCGREGRGVLAGHSAVWVRT